MNGLKVINDTLGHDAGDEAVRTYFGVIAAVIAEVGEAYRVGGDEVVIVLPKKSLADGAKLLGLILRGLSSQARDAIHTRAPGALELTKAEATRRRRQRR